MNIDGFTRNVITGEGLQEMRGLKDTPNYSIMPLGMGWQEHEIIRREREGTNLHLTKGTKYIHSALGAVSSHTKILRGHIKALKRTHFIDGVEDIKERFYLVHYIDWKVGRCYQLNSGKDFVFPLNIDILKGITERLIDGNETKYYETWAQCVAGVVSLISKPTKIEKQFRLLDLVEKYGSRNKALLMVKQKVIWTFSPERLTQIPVMFALGGKKKKKLIPTKYF